MPNLPDYIILDKQVGETPLDRLRAWQATRPDLGNTPLAYAGRLDPMASGKLLVLIGETCKRQTEYHNLDKTYTISVVFGLQSDSGDVLGLLTESGRKTVNEKELVAVLSKLIGPIALPYPIFSSRTVLGKPLHTWTLEGRLDEITIPTKESVIYDLSLEAIREESRATLMTTASTKIESLPRVTDPRKALGNDFRRPDIRQSWASFAKAGKATDAFTVATIACTCSSGTYMRTLAEVIAKHLETSGLAFSIHRDEIGRYDQVSKTWLTRF